MEGAGDDVRLPRRAPPFRRWAQKLHYSRWLRLITLLSIFASGAMVGIGLKQETSDAERIMGSDRLAAMLLTVDISFLLLLFVDLLVLVISFGLFSDPVHGALRPRHRMWFVVDCLVLVGTLVILCIPPLPPSSEGARTIKFVKSARLLCIVSRVKEMRSMFRPRHRLLARPPRSTRGSSCSSSSASPPSSSSAATSATAPMAPAATTTWYLWPRLPVSAPATTPVRRRRGGGAAVGVVAFGQTRGWRCSGCGSLPRQLVARAVPDARHARRREQPAEEAQWWPIVFFVVYTVVGSLFIFNLFIGAVISTFEATW